RPLGCSLGPGCGIAVDSVGSAYVTGQTSSFDFPTTTGAFQTTYAGGGDAFVAKIAEAIASSTPGKVTGGGYIEPDGTMSPAELLIQTGTNASVGGKATFGFVVQFTAGAANPTGNLTYNDHGANVTIKALPL